MPYSHDNESVNTGKIIGNTYKSESNLGFKSDVQNIIEGYAAEQVNLARDFDRILGREDTRSDFLDRCLESVVSSEAMHDSVMTSDAFYNNYSERLGQLIENSCNQIARESVMTGYAPITAYAPFFIKKQWVSCVWKDVLMSEVTSTPILNYKFERRYLKDETGTRYPIPDVYYQDDIMRKLYNSATGTNLDDTLDIELPATNYTALEFGTEGHKVHLIPEDTHYSEVANVLTHDIKISELKVTTKGAGEKWYPVNIIIDMTTHNWIDGQFEFIVKNENGELLTDAGLVTDDINKAEKISGTILGNVDFDNCTLNIFSTNKAVTHVHVAGKTANRFNWRSLDVERRVERIEKVMPESGPRLNSAVTVEEAADAIALGRIDMFADNVDMMGDALAQLNDFSMRSYVKENFDKQKAASQGVGRFGYPDYESLIEEGGFDAIPYAGYSTNISTWMADAKEYFERFLEELKLKLKTPEVTVVCVCHPTLVRYIRADVKWIFTDQTDVSGLKIQYNLGITTINGDRVHLISCQYLSPEDGIQTILIPTTSELITFKNVFYSVIVDRGYRNPKEQLVPNIMATQRTLTFDIIPVPGRFYIDGRTATPPKNLTKVEKVGANGKTETEYRPFYTDTTTPPSEVPGP